MTIKKVERSSEPVSNELAAAVLQQPPVLIFVAGEPVAVFGNLQRQPVINPPEDQPKREES